MRRIEFLPNGNAKVTVPLEIRNYAGRRRLIFPERLPDEPDPLAVNFARAFRWQKMLNDGRFESTTALAREIGVNESYVARTIRLTWLSPRIIEAAIYGTLPNNVSLARLYQCNNPLWKEQELELGLICR